jgi:hypothetical protein
MREGLLPWIKVGLLLVANEEEERTERRIALVLDRTRELRPEAIFTGRVVTEQERKEAAFPERERMSVMVAKLQNFILECRKRWKD